MHLYRENVEKSFSQNVLKTNGRNLQFMIKVVKLLRYNQNFVPWVLSALAPVIYRCMYKSLNVFFESARPNFARFNMGPSVEGRDNLFKWFHPLNKLAALPI